MHRKELLMKRFICMILIIFICFILQSSVFHAIALADVVPNLLLIITVGIAYMRGGNEAIFIAFFCGLLQDCMYGQVIGLYTLILIIIAFLCGLCNRIYYKDDFTIPIILVGISDLFYNFYIYIFEFLLRNRQDLFFYFHRIMLPEVIYTLVVSIVLYKLLHMLNDLLERSESEEA